MIQICHFNPDSDIEQVVPNLSVDISEIMATGVVASTGDSTPYTKETDVKAVGHYLKDKIQTCIAAIDLQRSMATQLKSSSPSQGNSHPATPAE